MADHIFERRGDAVMEVRCTSGEGAYRRRLESAQIAPRSGDIPTTGVGELSDFTRQSVSERVEGQIRRADRGRCGADIKEEEIVRVRAVVSRVVTSAAASSPWVHFVEQRLATRDLRPARIVVLDPCVEEIEPSRCLLHRGQCLRAATSTVRVKTSDANDVQLSSEERDFEVDDVGDNFGWGGGTLLRPHDIAPSLVLEAGALIRSDAVAAVPVDHRAAKRKVDGRHHATPVHESAQTGKAVWIVNRDEVPLTLCAWRRTSSEHATTQHHAVTGFPCLDRREVRVRVVRVQRVEYRMCPASLIE